MHVQHPHNGTDELWWPSYASGAQAAGSSSRGSGMRSSVQRQRASERERTLLREDWLLCFAAMWCSGFGANLAERIGVLLRNRSPLRNQA